MTTRRRSSRRARRRASGGASPPPLLLELPWGAASRVACAGLARRPGASLPPGLRSGSEASRGAPPAALRQPHPARRTAGKGNDTFYVIKSGNAAVISGGKEVATLASGLRLGAAAAPGDGTSRAAGAPGARLAAAKIDKLPRNREK